MIWSIDFSSRTVGESRTILTASWLAARICSWTWGAEKIIAADRDGKHIAVEVKSFEGQSEVHDLEVALGQ
jgi:hypothetical protein